MKSYICDSRSLCGKNCVHAGLHGSVNMCSLRCVHLPTAECVDVLCGKEIVEGGADRMLAMLENLKHE